MNMDLTGALTGVKRRARGGAGVRAGGGGARVGGAERLAQDRAPRRERGLPALCPRLLLGLPVTAGDRGDVVCLKPQARQLGSKVCASNRCAPGWGGSQVPAV